MPVVQKQVATHTKHKAPQGKPGSVLSRFRPIEEAVDDWVHALVYGVNRAGKTTFACQFPAPGILISVEPSRTGGAKSVKKVPGYVNHTLTSADDVQALGLELQELADSGDFPYKTVVLDSGTSLDELTLARVCGWDETANLLRWGRVSQDQYMERSDQMRKILRPFLGLPCHVIITANQKDHNSQEGKRNPLVKGLHLESFFAAAMGGGTTRWVQDGCDYILQLYLDKETKIVETEIILPGPKKEKRIRREEVETGRRVRRLRTALHPNFSAGVRSENPEAVPEYIQADTPKEMYDKFMKMVRGEKVS